ncbi:MAG: hypothetical protein AAGA81_12200 [Acidobacteriota bacterium]
MLTDAESYPYDLGDHSFEITTSSRQAQRWFDLGLAWTYGFHHEEAVRCFERALEHDAECVMALWGIAYALGPNYNKPWEAFDEDELRQATRRCHETAAKAQSLGDRVGAAERALVDALVHRYPSVEPVEDCAGWNPPYAAAMAEVYSDHQDHPDVAALFAEALMNLTPWELWDLAAGTPADGAKTERAREVLERALATDGGDRHPGLLHLYIHLMEMSPFPELALPAADALRDLVPDSGHLQHMPTHIDVLCGHYERVVSSNEAAIVADRKVLAADGALNFYSLYRCHDYHFKLYGAMFLGQLGPALEAADEMIATLPEELLRVESPPMADWLEGFVPMKLHVLIRFGRWQDILDVALPKDRELFCTTTAMTHYARGVAFAATGRTEEARGERELFRAAAERVPDSRYVFNNTCRDILAVASAMLDGEIEYRLGHFDDAFEHLRRSIALDDGLPYDEPWGWMQPTRHAYGALLLEQGHVKEAAAVYRADLGFDDALARAYQHPDNVWSLHGYHECLERLGQTNEARIIRQRLDLAVARADVPIEASCACRLTKA